MGLWFNNKIQNYLVIKKHKLHNTINISLMIAYFGRNRICHNVLHNKVLAIFVGNLLRILTFITYNSLIHEAMLFKFQSILQHLKL